MEISNDKRLNAYKQLLELVPNGYENLSERDLYNLLNDLPAPNWMVAQAKRDKSLLGIGELPEASEIFNESMGYVPSDKQDNIIATARGEAKARNEKYFMALGNATGYQSMFQGIINYAADHSNWSIRTLAERRKKDLVPMVLK